MSSPADDESRRGKRTASVAPSRWRRVLRVALPFAISAGLLAWVFSRIDAREALAYARGEVVLRFLGPLLLFNVATLLIEARCLHRVAGATRASLGIWTAARIKAASYLLSVLNYAVGAAGLSVLLRRRAGVGLADAASMVFLITLFDIGSVLASVAIGASFLEVEALGVRIGLVGALIAAIGAGFVFLRAPVGLGALDGLRQLDVFRAPRTAPIPLLIELGCLRSLFVLCYVALAWSLFAAFGIEIGLARAALGIAILLIVSVLPIAAGGLGTGQIAFVAIFSGLAPDAELLAASILFSLGLVSMRALLGLVFAPEYTREALAATREEAASTDGNAEG